MSSDVRKGDATFPLQNQTSLSQSVATYVRIKPPMVHPTSSDNIQTTSDDIITFKVSTQVANDGTKRDILDVEVPSDADPGLVYNNQNPDNGGKLIKYEFDKVFDGNSTQEEVFNFIAKDRIKDAIHKGINCSILAYGQTGSGKTYSICGGDAYADRGLIPRTISLLYYEMRQQQKLNKQRNSSSSLSSSPSPSSLLSLTQSNMVPTDNHITSFRCQITFIEIYKDIIYDLLPPPTQSSSQSSSDTPKDNHVLPGRQMKVKNEPSLPIVQVLEGPQDDSGIGQLVLKNINVYEAKTEEEALGLYFLGMTNRNTSATAMNVSSSRSHAIFTIIVETEAIKDNKTVFSRGKINLVDLAGSERVYKKTNSRGQINEAKSINLSLHYLEQVIVALRSSSSTTLNALKLGNTPMSSASGSKDKDHYVPYRNSVLTTLLRDSLGGNCRSCFLFTLSSEREHLEESISTCRFAQRCGEVKLIITSNSEVDLKDQIKELHSKLKAAERHAHYLEEQKLKLQQDLEAEKLKRKRLTEPRTLTADDKYQCKACVQSLLAAAKETLPQPLSTTPLGSMSASTSMLHQKNREMTTEERQQMLESSQDRLYNSVEMMDKAVLVELTVALGGLVQTLYIEREKARSQVMSLQQQLTNLDDKNTASVSVSGTESKGENIGSTPGKPNFDNNHTNTENNNNTNATNTAPISNVNTNTTNIATLLHGGTLLGDTKMSSFSMSHQLLGVDLPDDTIHTLVTGAAFIKHCRFGQLKIRYVGVTPDLLNICWRHIGNMQTQKTVPLKDYSRAEIDSIHVKGKESCLIALIRINRNERNLLIEYATHETLDENRQAAESWVTVLNVCIIRAQSVAASQKSY